MHKVHDLPPIFHYWSNRYVVPMLQQFGVSHPEEFLAKFLHESGVRTGAARPRFISLGSGNCDAEIRIAREIKQRGLDDFTIECLDINPEMLERGRQMAEAAGLADCVVPVYGDFNHWQPEGVYDGVMANQALHHVQELELLFDAVKQVLAPGALFVVSDIIGRNGHLRWPEALVLVREFWREMPESYRCNPQLSRFEDEFMDWDCSTEGFEGIRAQDILPLLVERFGFEEFLGFGNIILPFVDRVFGQHFDVANERDTAFIDRVHARDEAEMLAGRIKPTNMLAVMSLDKNAVCRHRPGLPVLHCLRIPDEDASLEHDDLTNAGSIHTAAAGTYSPG
jgi:SAM-dependent methyltransferase